MRFKKNILKFAMESYNLERKKLYRVETLLHCYIACMKKEKGLKLLWHYEIKFPRDISG